MLFELVWPGLAIGLLGSLHCIGMCGPIALALPGHGASRVRMLIGRMLYNGGRVITYTLLGVAAGLVGQLIRFASLQQALSIAAGVAILLAVLLPSRAARRFLPGNITERIWIRVRNLAGPLLRSHTMGGLFSIGLLNGLLPCGLVYVALAGATATGGVLRGALFMTLFGLGTVPVMLATSLSGPLLGRRIRRTLNRLLPVGAVVLAALLILRGMSLGIPYVSPDLSRQAESPQTPACH